MNADQRFSTSNITYCRLLTTIHILSPSSDPLSYYVHVHDWKFHDNSLIPCPNLPDLTAFFPFHQNHPIYGLNPKVN
jgi:hypothetical protein